MANCILKDEAKKKVVYEFKILLKLTYKNNIFKWVKFRYLSQHKETMVGHFLPKEEEWLTWREYFTIS